jgi:hypothetical protein
MEIETELSYSHTGMTSLFLCSVSNFTVYVEVSRIIGCIVTSVAKESRRFLALYLDVSF